MLVSSVRETSVSRSRARRWRCRRAWRRTLQGAVGPGRPGTPGWVAARTEGGHGLPSRVLPRRSRKKAGGGLHGCRARARAHARQARRGARAAGSPPSRPQAGPGQPPGSVQRCGGDGRDSRPRRCGSRDLLLVTRLGGLPASLCGGPVTGDTKAVPAVTTAMLPPAPRPAAARGRERVWRPHRPGPRVGVLVRGRATGVWRDLGPEARVRGRLWLRGLWGHSQPSGRQQPGVFAGAPAAPLLWETPGCREPPVLPLRPLVPAPCPLPSLSRPPHARLWRRHHLQIALFFIFGRAGNPITKGNFLSSFLIRAWHYRHAASLWLCRSCVSDANYSQRLSSCISISDCRGGLGGGGRPHTSHAALPPARSGGAPRAPCGTGPRSGATAQVLGGGAGTRPLPLPSGAPERARPPAPGRRPWSPPATCTAQLPQTSASGVRADRGSVAPGLASVPAVGSQRAHGRAPHCCVWRGAPGPPTGARPGPCVCHNSRHSVSGAWPPAGPSSPLASL